MSTLTLEKLLLLLPYDSPSEQLRAVNISDKGIARLPKLAFLKNLKKLIASKNVMTDLSSLSVLVTLSHLDISSNPALVDLVPLRPLVNLSVINISNCKVSSLRGLEGCRSLSALVANDNRIVLSGADGKTGGDAGVANLDVLKVLGATLETVILSRNPSLCGGYKPTTAPTPVADGAEVDDEAVSRIQEDPNHPLTVFASTYFPKLKKISLSECEITSLPPRWFLPFATEVRLARNRIPYFPSAVIMRSVRILDLSHNLLEHYNSLRRQRYLVQLTIKGNPLSHLKEYQRVRSEKEAEGLPEGASEDALQTVTISPLEVLYIRSSFSDLTHLDGRKLTDPPAPAQKKDIQHAIHALQKKLLPKAAPAVAEEVEAIVEDVQVAEEESSEVEGEGVVAGPEPAPEVVKGKQRIKRLASAHEFDPEEDGLMDESLMSRRRRRQEEDGGVEAEAPAPMVVKKRSTDSALKGAKLRKSLVQEGAVVGTKRPRSEVPPPPAADSGSDIEDVAYEIPTAVRAALLDPAKGASNLVKRERALAPPVAPTNNHGNNRNSRHQQQKPPAPTIQGASALAALRASTSQTSGW